MINVPTPHNEAKKGDIADIVIMPGDPLRAKYIADKYLTDVICYNKVRNMYGFTGYYKGVRISVQASGMGIPSIGIYSKELFEAYDVDTIIRVGSAGALSNNISIRDIVVSETVDSDSNYASLVGLGDTSLTASTILLDEVKKYVEDNNIKGFNIGKTFTSILFYSDEESLKKLSKDGYLAVEMETTALYANAKLANKNALAIFTISDNPFTGESLPSIERQESFDKMLEIALNIAILRK